ncbi:MAG TPA: prepilin-type N-terminal cleavage/methylation domain-containing protein [Myxococcales bacterium]|jgi:prepilin-type N-terminal cleavage/methylation domain-containing protein
MLTREKMLRLRRHARGFSLIELGIVIAVIAVLAAVVIFGRGFIAAGRVSKAVEGFNSIRKAGATLAGLRGGSFSGSAAGNEITGMGKRGLLSLPNPADTTWTMAGGPDVGTAFVAQDIQFGTITYNSVVGVNAVAIKLKAPDGTAAEDVWNSVTNDKNFIDKGATIGSLNCTSTRPTTQDVNIYCFKL